MSYIKCSIFCILNPSFSTNSLPTLNTIFSTTNFASNIFVLYSWYSFPFLSVLFFTKQFLLYFFYLLLILFHLPLYNNIFILFCIFLTSYFLSFYLSYTLLFFLV